MCMYVLEHMSLGLEEDVLQIDDYHAGDAGVCAIVRGLPNLLQLILARCKQLTGVVLRVTGEYLAKLQVHNNEQLFLNFVLTLKIQNNNEKLLLFEQSYNHLSLILLEFEFLF